MHFLLVYEVGAEFVERRVPFRDGHLALARQAHERGELVVAGALAEPVDTVLLLFRGDSPAVAERFVAADPYVLSGLVHRWRVRPWIASVAEDAATHAHPNG
jgi:uncharacterized protein YciI